MSATTVPATPTELLIAVFAKSPADVELILQEVAAAVGPYVEALRDVTTAWDAYTEATAGRSHRPDAHNAELAGAFGMGPRDRWSSVDEQRACSKCAGAEYGTEADLSLLMDDALGLLAQDAREPVL